MASTVIFVNAYDIVFFRRIKWPCREVVLAFEVPANAFSPPPKVDSAVVVLEPFPDLKLLGEVTMAAFGQRRKMLRKSLKSIAKKYGADPEPWCESCKIDPQKRPETLSVAEFQKLTRALIN